MSLKHFLPEFILAGTALLILVLDLVAGDRRRSLWPWLGIVGLGLAGVAAAGGSPDILLFENMIAADGFSLLFKFFFATVGALTLIMILRSQELRHSGGELTAILLIVILGLNMMAAAANLLMAYLAMETVSILSYTLVARLRGSRRGHEAGLKYIIFGGVASGAMLIGLSFLYGMTGTLDMAAMSDRLSDPAFAARSGNLLALFSAVTLVLVGLGFKVAAVPFHMWCPDVYEGAPVSITAFLSVGPKAAGFALMMRLFYTALAEPGADGWVAVAGLPWPLLIAIISVATMFVGNLGALWQDNLKRLFAYSSIAHAGYLLMGVVLLTQAGVTAIAVYLFAYLIMNFGAFMVISAVADSTGTDEMSAIEGLWKRNAFLAVMMMVFLVSLIGIPPAFGFIGKLYLFAALLKSGWIWLALIGLLNSVISLAYYMRVAKVMLIDGTGGEAEPPFGPFRAPLLLTATVGVLAVLTLVFGLYWEPLYLFVSESIKLI